VAFVAIGIALLVVTAVHGGGAVGFVLGSPRKTLVDRRRGVFGTTVDRVLRRAPCRVMIAAATNGSRA